MELWQFLISHSSEIGQQTLEHIGLTFAAMGGAVTVGLPLGIWITRQPKIAPTILNLVGLVQTIPSIALLGFMIPLIGIGPKAAIFALFLYALLPIVQNTYTGIREVDPTLKEAGKGMGMNSWQLLKKIEIPRALNVIFAGIRTSTIINIGFATLAALIASGGLGKFIFDGIALNNTNMILAGAIPAALLAIFFDFSLQQGFKRFLLIIGFVIVLVTGTFLLIAPGQLGKALYQAGKNITQFPSSLSALIYLPHQIMQGILQVPDLFIFFGEVGRFMINRSSEVLKQTLEHIGLTFSSLFLAMLIGIPVGIWASRNERWAPVILKVTSVFQTIPSIAVLGFMIPLIGIGYKPAIVALFLYALLPIVHNTYTGIKEIGPALREAGQGMGMSKWQLLKKVELPLALPVIFAGIRTATIINIGVATLAAFIASGGFGVFILGGIALNDTRMILAGAIPAALLALFFDIVLGQFQKLKLKYMPHVLIGGATVMVLFTISLFYPTTISSDLKAGFTYEFVGRKDGMAALQRKYDLKVNRAVMQPSLMYDAVKEEKVDIISGYTTDGRVKSYNLRVLEDNKNAFPPYHCAPVIRADVLQQYPIIDSVFQKLQGRIGDSTMRLLNYRVDELDRSPRHVAQHFLEDLGLYRPAKQGDQGPIIIASKMFTEQYILAHLFQLMIEGHTHIDTKLKTGMGGSKLCFDAMLAGEVDIYPEYTGSGLYVMLNTPSSVLDSLGQSKDDVYNYVNYMFKKKYNIVWLPSLGFNNSYDLMMREEQAQQLGIKTVSDLKEYLSTSS